MRDVLNYHELLISGALQTIWLSLLSGVLTIIFALIIAMCGVHPNKYVRAGAQWYSDILRSIPLLVLLMYLYFGIGPYVEKYGLSAFWLAVIGLTLSQTAYMAEVYRGIIKSPPNSQWQAGYSLGLNWWQVCTTGILGQCRLAMIPATLNQIVTIIKNSSMASLITVTELTLSATLVVSETFAPMETYLLLALIYILLVQPIARTASWIEKRTERRQSGVPLAATTAVPADLAAGAGARPAAGKGDQ